MIHQVSSAEPPRATPQSSSESASSLEPCSGSSDSEEVELNSSGSRRRHLGITRDKSKWVLQKKTAPPAACLEQRTHAWGTPVVAAPKPRALPVSRETPPLDERWLQQPPLPVAGACIFTTVGLRNPVNSKICYLNSVVQVLLPVTALFKYLSLSNFQASQQWLRAMSRVFGGFLSSSTTPVNLLSIAGVERLVADEFGAIGQQHDTGEALVLVLERLHAESRWPLLLPPSPSPRGPGLDEDSLIYRLFRGSFAVNDVLPSGEQRFRDEMFLTLQVAPSSAVKRTDLATLLASTFRPSPVSGVPGETKQISALQPVLVVELSRHLSENKEIMSQAFVSFPGTLQLPDSCLAEAVRGSQRRYELTGVVVRSGLYSNSGHYWAAQRRNADWHWVNDEEVTRIDQITEAMITDTRGLISSALEASASWCLLLYVDQEATLSFQP
jgi:Ubiquitin carboxyl-terminal hydrolase